MLVKRLTGPLPAASILAAAAIVLCGCHLGPATAAEKKIVLKEELNQSYGNELLSYPFEAAAGECDALSLSVSGPQGAVPAQFTDTVLWPGTRFIKSARITFIAPALTPLASDEYTATYGPMAAAKTNSDLSVKNGEGWVEVSDSHIGARLLVGDKKYDAPVAAATVPGPLQGYRGADGAWSGGSTVFGPLGVKAWSSEVVESGPALVEVAMHYTFADDSRATFEGELVAGDSKLLWKVSSSSDRVDQGVNFDLVKVPGVKLVAVPRAWGQWAKARTIAITDTTKPIALLSPNSSLINSFPDSPADMILAAPGGAELRLDSRDPAAWVDPVKPLTYGGFDDWQLDMIPLSWENWRRKQLPVSYGADGLVSMKVNFAKGRRLWSIGDGAPLVGERLNVIKDYVLDWKTPADLQHPLLFMSKAEVAAAQKTAVVSKGELSQYVNGGGFPNANTVKAYYLTTGDQNVAMGKKLADQARLQLSKLGDYDTMRYGIAAAGLYDAVIDSGLLSARDRDLLRAQIAYLAYVSADPMTWSMERGYHSGNPNMSISYTLTLGVIACAIPDHPMAKTWTDYATAWMDKWLTVNVGPNGEWKPEGGHYSQVSLAPLVAYAIAAKRAGFHDFTNDPRLKKLLLYFAKVWTPADPQHNNVRTSPTVGRGTTGDPNGVFGFMARMTAKSDPAYSAIMQWMWAKSDYYAEMGDFRLGGYEPLFGERDLPAVKPNWQSELFPSLGVILRDGVGDPLEHYVNVISNDDSKLNLDIWTPEIGNIAEWFAYGQPLSHQFTFEVGYNERHELLHGGVGLSHNWGEPGDSKWPFGYYTTTKPQGFVATPGADYVAATYDYTKVDDREWWPETLTPMKWPRVKPATAPVLHWTRQTMFVKDAALAGPHYLVVRDTTSGGQPTTWQFWTLSDKLGTADQAKNADAFLADKPGDKQISASQLPPGQRYTALGQFGVDVDYYIASPTDTPRSTLRFGGSYARVPQWQDLMHLQLPGDGTYFVVMYPHTRATAAPVFSTLGAGTIIKVAGDFGTDYNFLTPTEGSATAEGAVFNGTSGSVQAHTADIALTLGAPGKVAYKGWALSGPIAAGLRVSAKTASISIAAHNAPVVLTLTLPGKWRPAKGSKGVKLKQVAGGSYQLTAAAGVESVQLEG